MGWYYNPPPQPTSLVPEPPGTGAVGNAPPSPIGDGAIPAAIRATWPIEAWPAQSGDTVAATLATALPSPPFPTPYWNSTQWALIRANWPGESWPAQVLTGGGIGGLTASVFIGPQAVESVEAEWLITIRAAWTPESWPAQRAPQIASQFAAVVNPPVSFAAPTLSRLMGILGTWGPEAWYAQSEGAVAAGLANIQVPPLYLPSSRTGKLAQIVSAWPREDWSAQAQPPRAGWIPPPVTAKPAPVPHNELWLWPQESWSAQRAPAIAAGFATAPAGTPFVSHAQRMAIRMAWPTEDWAAQRSILGAGLQSLFAPVPLNLRLRHSTVSLWPQPDWAAQAQAPIAAGLATVQPVPPAIAPTQSSPIALWAQEAWAAQRAPAPAALVANVQPPPSPPAGFRVMAISAGVYRGQYYNPGDVFDILVGTDFSDGAVNYESAGAEFARGWMIRVPPNTALFQLESVSPTFPAVDPNRRFVL